MKMSNTRHSLAVLVISLLVFSGTCSDQPFEPEPQDADLTISMQVSASVEAVSVEITADDIVTPIVENIPVSNGVASGTVTVPVGSSRLIAVHAFDENAIETHRGSTTVNVVAGENLLVEITLTPLTGEQPIIATAGTYAVTIDPIVASIDVLESVQFTATVTGANDEVIQDPVLRWGSLNPIVAEVDQNGLVTGGHAGVTSIVVNYLGIAAAAEVVVAGELVQRLAFVSYRDGNSEIYVVDESGAGLVNLTNNDADDGNPTWSPDGTRIAFTSSRDGDPEVYVMNADGSGVFNVSNDGDLDTYSLSWSPDGNRIAYFASSQSTGQIRVANADGSGSENLTGDLAVVGRVDWSPAGDKIVFNVEGEAEYDWEIYTMNPDGTELLNITNNDSRFEERPVWSPDGTKIVFVAGGQGINQDIYVMNADGTNLTNLTNNPSYESHPSWSPNGTRIVYLVEVGDTPESQIYVMNSDGSGATNLTNNPAYYDHLPKWSPDGSKIAFVSNRVDGWDINVMNTDGTGVRNLTNNPASDSSPAWGGVLIFPGPGY